MSGVTHVDAADIAGAGTALRADGVVVVDHAFDPSAIDALRTYIMGHYPDFQDKARLGDFQDNGDGRFIAPVVVDSTLWDSGVLQHPSLIAIASAALGERWVYEAVGMLMAFPGCAVQGEHRDGSPLFPDTPLGAVLPPFALTVMIPLTDVAEGGGTTAFRLGTHRYDDRLAEKDPVTSPLARGSFAVWDLEIRHWGLANESDRPRPTLYLTLCRPFWLDMANFGGLSRIKLRVDDAVIPQLDRRFERAKKDGRWAHGGLGEALRPIPKTTPNQDLTGRA